MEKRLIAGAFREMAVHGRDVYLVAREPPGAHHGETPTAISVVRDGVLEPIAQRDDPWLEDLYATDTSLLWSEQRQGKATAWRRAVSALDLVEPGETLRSLLPVVSMREGIIPDGRGGAVISIGNCLAWLPRGARDIVPIVEPLADVLGDTRMLLTYISACVADGASVIWTTSDDLRPPSRLCRVPLEGGPIEILHVAERGNLLVYGASAEGILFEDENQELALRLPDGRIERVAGPCLNAPSRMQRRAHGENLWFLPRSPSDEESSLHVFRAGSRRLEALPFDALRFDVSEFGIYRLTHGGVYETPWS